MTREIAGEWRSQVDHAARNETSLMMHYRPRRVDLGQLSPDRTVQPVGVAGQDPRDATAEFGRQCLEQSVELVRQMLRKGGLLS